MLLLLTISTMVGCTVGDDKVKIDDYSPIETPNEIPELEDALTEATAIDKKNDESNEKDPNRTEIEVVQERFWVEGKTIFIKELPAWFYHRIPSVAGIKEITYTRVYKNNEVIEEIINEEKTINDAEPEIIMYGDDTISRYAYSILCNLYTWAEDSDNLTWGIANTNLVVKLNGSNFFSIDSGGMDFAYYPSFDELKIVFKILGYDDSKIEKIKIAYDEIKNGARTADAGLAFFVNDKFGFKMGATPLGVSDEAYKATLDLDAIYEANKGNWK